MTTQPMTFLSQREFFVRLVIIPHTLLEIEIQSPLIGSVSLHWISRVLNIIYSMEQLSRASH